MIITSDWHIHSQNSCDGACMAVADLIRSAAEKGISDYGVTDHIHTPFNMPDLAASRKEYLANEPPPGFHFGVEVSCMSRWEIEEIATGKYNAPVYGIRTGGPVNAVLAIGLNAEDVKTYQIEYVIGGTHWPMYVPMERKAIIRSYHRQNMYLATHPLVDIVAHPWWWHKHWQDSDGFYRGKPWFDNFNRIPKSMHKEFAAAAIECNTMVEINFGAILLEPAYTERFKQQYLEYLAELKSQGVKFSVGSDCHSAQYDTDFEKAALMLDAIDIKDEDLWKLPPSG